VPGQSIGAARQLLSRHDAVVWWAAPVEVRSTLERLRREGAISPRAYETSKTRLDTLLASWREIQPSEAVRALACIQLERFALRAADALHLSAAIVWCNQKPRGRLFVRNDKRLVAAAGQAGFTVRSV